jgi:hydrogenase large subunit
VSFENLPIEVDAQGNTRLKSGVADPYSYRGTPAPPQAGEWDREDAGGGRTLTVDFDPVTRVPGPLAFHTAVDPDNRQVLEAASMATLFRGYEVILQGRDPRDAVFISSRACGVCGGVHSTASALALEMAFGIHPPPFGIVARNLLVSLEYLSEHPSQLFLRAGPDFSEPVMREKSGELWERAEAAACPGRAVHGYETVAEIMTGLTRSSGDLYVEALSYIRLAREAYALIGGKYPHPQTVVPGGVSSTIDTSDMNEMMLRIYRFFDYGQKVVAVWDDLVDFLYEANPRYREIGQRPKNLIDLGQWDDPFAYDANYETSPMWGERRWATPGAIVDGQLVTTNLQHLNVGVEEFVEHSFYDDWTGDGNGHLFKTDPAGNPLSPNHPWNKETIPRPAAIDRRGKYSWATAPRWDRRAMETGPYSRLWLTAAASKLPHRRFVDATGHSLRLYVPKSELPPAELEWQIPESWGALERHRARAYALPYAALVSYDNLLIGLDLKRKGEDAISTPFRVPRDFRVGVGFWGGARGYLTHHVIMDDGVIQNYQILAPSTWTASPRDPFGNPGPQEEAVAATPLLGGSYERPEDYIDVLRAIRSFDPCMPCATH